MLVATASLFAVGVGLFIYDFFRHAPRFELTTRSASRCHGSSARTRPRAR